MARGACHFNLSLLVLTITILGSCLSAMSVNVTQQTAVNSTVPAATKKPWFCHGLDCPHFSVVKSTSDYEVRKYVRSSWVSTSIDEMDFSEASTKLFMRLFKYISGNNVAKKKIAMTCPVLTRIIPGQGPNCENNFTMSFFNAQTDMPRPTDPTVFLSEMPSMTVFTTSFSGFASKDDWLKHGAQLAAALQRDGVKFNEEHYFAVGYDSPYRLFGRHNEIWFVAA